AQMIDVIIQGLLYGTAFQLIGLANGFILGFILGLLNLMPYLGVLSGLCVTLPIAFFHGGLGYTCVLLAIICCIQTFDGYVMQPYIQGNRMKLSAWQIVFAILFWTQLGGFLGLLLAIPLTAFVKASWGEWRASSERFVAGASAPTPPTP
ncbi:MAG: AI-2E family transporter, partial [Candidatus Spyradenecus sp.]